MIGDALGPLGSSAAGGVEWRGPTRRAALEFVWERYENEDLYFEGDPRSMWTKEDRPDERRLRLIADWVVDPRPGRVGTSIRLGVERVNGFDFDPALSRFNGLAQLRFEVRPR